MLKSFLVLSYNFFENYPLLLNRLITMQPIKENLINIRKRVESAAINAGRDPQSVKLVAVSKRIPVSAIRQASMAGQVIFGENYMQEAKEKLIQLQDRKVEWHFIGHIQSNKAKDAATHMDTVHTVDRLKLAKALNKYAAENNRQLSVLVQVNVGEELQKSGVLPAHAESLIKSICHFSNLKVTGLMTMPPFKADPEEVRPYFRKLRELGEEFAAKEYFSNNENFDLSMGMSGDFEVAIEEGATLVRVGTAIFGPRPPLKQK